MRYFVTSVFAISLLGSSAAMAQQVDCANPLTQSDMNICAADMYRAADGDLNLAYRMAQPKRAKWISTSRLAWIPFRDKACSAESKLGVSNPKLGHFDCTINGVRH